AGGPAVPLRPRPGRHDAGRARRGPVPAGAAQRMRPWAPAPDSSPAGPVDPPRTWADRARFWRSPAGQPVWARPALLAVAAVAAVLYGGRLADEGFAVFYAPAVRSMS